MITLVGKEGCDSGSGTGCVVVGELSEWKEFVPIVLLVVAIHMIQSLGCPFNGVGRKCTEPLVYGWAEIYQVPLYTVGPRYINHPFLRFGPDISTTLCYASAEMN